nr:endoglucanase 25-like [Ziziphus jujuba var. spinosa]
MSREGILGGSMEIETENPADDDDRNSSFGRSSYGAPSEEVKRSWLLRPESDSDRTKIKKHTPCVNMLFLKNFLIVVVLGTIITIIVGLASTRRHHNYLPKTDNNTVALHHALFFFNAQRLFFFFVIFVCIAGRLPEYNNVSWRGDSCLNDGVLNSNNLVGGYYDAGDASKFHFPASFAMTILSWSVIEYSGKYEAIGELDHVKDIIKWGTDYLLQTFDSYAPSVANVVSQVVGGDTSSGGTNSRDQDCWIRPEDIDSHRTGQECYNCPALADEMAAALASASIVFKDNSQYSKKLVHGADLLFKFATKGQGENYSGSADPPSAFYNSTGFWDEFMWGGTWLYFASGNSSYLNLVVNPVLARLENALWTSSDRGVFSWNNKHAGVYLLLTRLRIFLNFGYPEEAMLSKYHQQIDDIMCSYLPVFPSFNRTNGGLIQLNHGKPQPLQYVVNAAFLAKLYSDYLDALLVPGWYCGPTFYQTETLRDFSNSQIDYILGKNPQNMSYVVGFGEHFPKHVYHEGSSIPSNKTKYSCKEGAKWRESSQANPNTIVGAMVAGPDKNDVFQDIRSNYNYTKPSLAGNAGLVAALVALSGGTKSTAGIDRDSIFYKVPPSSLLPLPSPSPWIPP